MDEKGSHPKHFQSWDTIDEIKEITMNSEGSLQKIKLRFINILCWTKTCWPFRRSQINIILKFIIPYYSRYIERSTGKIGAMVQCSKIFSRYFNFWIILYCAPLSVSMSANVLPSIGHKYKYVALNFCIISRPRHLVYK